MKADAPAAAGAGGGASAGNAADYWIIVHRDLRRTACVRAVMDWVRQVFAEQRDVIAGTA